MRCCLIEIRQIYKAWLGFYEDESCKDLCEKISLQVIPIVAQIYAIRSMVEMKIEEGRIPKEQKNTCAEWIAAIISIGFTFLGIGWLLSRVACMILLIRKLCRSRFPVIVKTNSELSFNSGNN